MKLTVSRSFGTISSLVLLFAVGCGGSSNSDGTGTGGDGSQPLVVTSYSADPTSGVVALTVNFAATQAANIVTYNWDFGDGMTGAGATTAHTYVTAGTYSTSVTVEDALGNTASSSQNIYVFASIDNSQVIVPDNVLFYDDFEYNVSRDGSDLTINKSTFLSAGWSNVKGINLTGGHNGYIYTVTSIPGYAGPFPGRGSNSVLAIEGRAGLFSSQTDFYLQFGDIDNSDENVPGDVWYQFWMYTNDYGDQRSRFSNRDKLIYPCRGQYSCNVQNNYLLYAGSGSNAPYWTDSLGGPGATAERYFVLHGNVPSPPQMSVPNEPYAKLGHNLDTYHLVPNQWQLVKLHFDTSGPQGTFEVWIKPLGGEFIKVAEWISGQNGFTWNVLSPGGHKMFRMPTTLPGANNTQFYDSWVYMDDFALAASEDELPQYPY